MFFISFFLSLSLSLTHSLTHSISACDFVVRIFVVVAVAVVVVVVVRLISNHKENEYLVKLVGVRVKSFACSLSLFLSLFFLILALKFCSLLLSSSSSLLLAATFFLLCCHITWEWALRFEDSCRRKKTTKQEQEQVRRQADEQASNYLQHVYLFLKS